MLRVIYRRASHAGSLGPLCFARNNSTEIQHVYSVIFFNPSAMMSQLITVNDVSSLFNEGLSRGNLLIE